MSIPQRVVSDTEQWDRTCLNCGATLYGVFCSECGQRAAPPHPSLRELAGDAIGEFFGWDGKFVETIRLLMLRPGQLTLEFLEGRRVRFIQPLRLYLACSVVFFFLSAITPTTVHVSTTTTDAKTGVTSTVTRDETIDKVGQVLSPEDKAAINAELATAPAAYRPVLKRLAEDPEKFRAQIFDATPKLLFVLLPVFAAIVKLFYRRRRFAEHLYFALHVHAFTFVALTLNDVVKLAGFRPLALAAGVIVLIWVPVYWHRAFRRVYGGPFGSQLAKETGISLLYAIASIPGLIALAVWIAYHG